MEFVGEAAARKEVIEDAEKAIRITRQETVDKLASVDVGALEATLTSLNHARASQAGSGAGVGSRETNPGTSSKGSGKSLEKTKSS